MHGCQSTVVHMCCLDVCDPVARFQGCIEMQRCIWLESCKSPKLQLYVCIGPLCSWRILFTAFGTRNVLQQARLWPPIHLLCWKHKQYSDWMSTQQTCVEACTTAVPTQQVIRSHHKFVQCQLREHFPRLQLSYFVCIQEVCLISSCCTPYPGFTWENYPHRYPLTWLGLSWWYIS